MKPNWILAAAIPMALLMPMDASAASPPNDSQGGLLLVSAVLFLSLPPIAIAADRRAKASRKSRNLPTLALLCWIVELVAMIGYIGSGAWYCENCANRSDDWAWLVLLAVALPWAAAFHAFKRNPKAR